MAVRLGPGVTFANHRIEAEIGRGGMGVVYRARELTLDSIRALKVVSDDLASDVRFRERFRREARLAASVDHPNVIPVHHAGEESGLPYLSMTLMEGPDLGTLVASEGTLEPARASKLISEIAAGLEAAHARGLVHRDVKPSNILIQTRNAEERAVITDFGLSRLVEEDQGITQTGDFLGSTDYVAPEQIEDDAVDGRADVYSLGALAFFLLTGQAPFAGRSEAAKLVAHVNAIRPRPSDFGAPTAPAVDCAIARAMAVDRAERFATPALFASAFTASVTKGPGIVKPSPLIGVAVAVVAAVAVAFLLALGGEAKAPTVSPASASPGSAREEAVIAVKDGPIALATHRGVTWLAARDAGALQGIPSSSEQPDAAREVNLGAGATPRSVSVGFGSLWIADENRLVRASLSGDEEPVSIPLEGEPKDVVMSPQSVWVALEDSDEVTQIDPATNAVIERLPVADGPRSVAYGDGGLWVACIEGGVVLRIDVRDGRVEGKPISAGTRPTDVAVGDDGIWVIDNLEGVIRRIDPETLESDEPIEVGARPRGVVFARNSVWVANSEDGTVTEIDESDRRQSGTPIRVGAGPADISEGGGFIWTANFDDDTVSRIELP